jgi:glycosyltransferase involved in cell wall biosynthesis
VNATGEVGVVSVMIPAHNAAETLRETLDSVLRQTYRPIEVVIVDDGSSDGTGHIASEFASAVAGDQLTVIVRRQENRGLLATRNVALGLSHGEFLQFLDADDVLHPQKVAMCVREMATGEWDVVVPRTTRFRSTEALGPMLAGAPLPRLWKRSELLCSSITSTYWHTIGPLFRRSIVMRVGEFPRHVHPVVEEMEFHGRVKLATRRIRYLPWLLNFYRVGKESSVTGNIRRLYEGRLQGASVATQMLVNARVSSAREWASLYWMSLKTYSQIVSHDAGTGLSREARESWLAVAGSWHPWLAAACRIPPAKPLEFMMRSSFRLRQRIGRKSPLKSHPQASAAVAKTARSREL